MSVHSDLDVPFEKGKSLPCLLTQPNNKSSPTGVILAHGAGGDMHSGNLAYHAETFAEAGCFCLRFTCKPTRLPYRVKACQAILDAAAELPALASVTTWIFAGHSMGARVASAMAAANPSQALGCVFFSYPMHPPGDQANLRDATLVDLSLPVLFVRGSQDSMCEANVFTAIKARMQSANLQVHEVAGADHALKVHARKESRSKTEQALHAVSEAVCQFVETLKQDYLAKQVEPPAAQQKAICKQKRSTDLSADAANCKRKRKR